MQYTLNASVMLLCCLVTACKVTDHGEEPGEVSAADIHTPASGYRGSDPSALPVLTFDADTIDAGRIAQGTVISRTYSFVNSGKSELIIADVRSTCGCTVGKTWPKQPMKPGERGEIEVTFDSEGRSGTQLKTVSVITNAQPPTHTLILKSEVVAPGTN